MCTGISVQSVISEFQSRLNAFRCRVCDILVFMSMQVCNCSKFAATCTCNGVLQYQIKLNPLQVNQMLHYMFVLTVIMRN